MIAFVEGVLEDKSPARAVLNVGGVGYEVLIPLSTYDRIPGSGATCRLLTHDYIKEDQHQLFGFVTQEELTMFTRLISISGIGPKLALSALSSLTVSDLIEAINQGDTARLSSISGVGKKVAERMVVELRDKMGALYSQFSDESGAAIGGDTRFRDAVLALAALGYKAPDAQKMVQKSVSSVDDAMTVEDIIRLTLKK